MGMLPHEVLQGESVRLGMAWSCNKNNVSAGSLKRVNGFAEIFMCITLAR